MRFARNKRWLGVPLTLCLSTAVFAEERLLSEITVGKVLGKRPGVYVGVLISDGSVNLRSRGMSRDAVQVGDDGERPAANSRTPVARTSLITLEG